MSFHCGPGSHGYNNKMVIKEFDHIIRIYMSWPNKYKWCKTRPTYKWRCSSSMRSEPNLLQRSWRPPKSPLMIPAWLCTIENYINSSYDNSTYESTQKMCKLHYKIITMRKESETGLQHFVVKITQLWFSINSFLNPHF